MGGVDRTTLFLKRISRWEYPEHAVEDLRSATVINDLTYYRDGRAYETVRVMISESVAQQLDDQEQRYLVLLGGEERPDALVTVAWFLYVITRWEYPEDAAHDVGTATKITRFSFEKDGTVRESIGDMATGTVKRTSRSGVPLETHWEPVPEFGDWSSIARRDRGGT